MLQQCSGVRIDTNFRRELFQKGCSDRGRNRNQE
jgi:hypothetical protein